MFRWVKRRRLQARKPDRIKRLDLSSILGIMSTLGAIKSRKPGQQITGALGKLFSGVGGGSTGSTGTSSAIPQWAWTPEERQAYIRFVWRD
jgi:hypothetical protein